MESAPESEDKPTPQEKQDTPARPDESLGFLTVAAHDLKGALANIRSFTAFLLEKDAVADPRIQRGLTIVLRNSERALRLSEQIFDAWRARTSGISLDLSPVEVAPLALAAARFGEQLSERQSVRWEHALPKDLGRAMADGARLLRAFEALAAEAVAWAEPNGAVVHSARAGEDIVELSWVCRAACSPEVMADLFALERRVAHERTLEPALGTWLAREVVRRMGGEVTGRLGPRGPELWLRLPTHQPL